MLNRRLGLKPLAERRTLKSHAAFSPHDLVCQDLSLFLARNIIWDVLVHAAVIKSTWLSGPRPMKEPRGPISTVEYSTLMALGRIYSLQYELRGRP